MDHISIAWSQKYDTHLLQIMYANVISVIQLGSEVSSHFPCRKGVHQSYNPRLHCFLQQKTVMSHRFHLSGSLITWHQN